MSLAVTLIPAAAHTESFACPDSLTPVSYTLTPPDDTLQLPSSTKPWPSSERIRFDICWDDRAVSDAETAFLHQILWNDGQSTVSFDGHPSLTQGLQDALFGDTSSMTLSLATRVQEPERIITLQGLADPNRPLIAVTLAGTGDSRSYWGIFEMGDPFQTDDCSGDEVKDVKTYRLDQATLQTTRCVRETGSGTDLIRLLEITYEDHTSQLSTDQQRPIQIKGLSLEGVARYTTTHHNCNDSIELHLPFVDWSVQFDVYQKRIQMEATYEGQSPLVKITPWTDVPPNCGVYDRTGASGGHKALIRNPGPNPYKVVVNGTIAQFDAAMVNVTYQSRGTSATQTFWIYRTYTMSDLTTLGKPMTSRAQQVTDAQLLEAVLKELERFPSATRKAAIDNLTYQLQKS